MRRGDRDGGSTLALRPARRHGRAALALSIGVVLALAAAVPAAGDRPAALREVAFDQRIGERLPLDVVLRDETGASVRLGDYFGSRPVILVPAYYECPMLCTVVLNGVTATLRSLSFDVGKEFTVVTFSFNPRETSALAARKKAGYVGRYGRPGADAGWHFLTGDEDQIRRLTDAMGFRYTWDAAQQQYAHASGLVVATPDGRLSRYLYGVEFPARDLRLALVEASAGRLGTSVDALLLFCFHYDATTGRYGAAAMNAVRAGGVVTLLALGIGIAVLRRREGRSRA
jgi:protein SCO1/2